MPDAERRTQVGISSSAVRAETSFRGSIFTYRSRVAARRVIPRSFTEHSLIESTRKRSYLTDEPGSPIMKTRIIIKLKRTPTMTFPPFS